MTLTELFLRLYVAKEYRAVVQSTASETFFQVKLEFEGCKVYRWFKRESIVKRTSAAFIGIMEQDEESDVCHESVAHELKESWI